MEQQMVELGGAGRTGIATSYCAGSGCEDVSRVVVPAAWLRAAGWIPADEAERLICEAIDRAVDEGVMVGRSIASKPRVESEANKKEETKQ